MLRISGAAPFKQNLQELSKCVSDCQLKIHMVVLVLILLPGHDAEGNRQRRSGLRHCIGGGASKCNTQLKPGKSCNDQLISK